MLWQLVQATPRLSCWLPVQFVRGRTLVSWHWRHEALRCAAGAGSRFVNAMNGLSSLGARGCHVRRGRPVARLAGQRLFVVSRTLQEQRPHLGRGEALELLRVAAHARLGAPDVTALGRRLGPTWRGKEQKMEESDQEKESPCLHGSPSSSSSPLSLASESRASVAVEGATRMPREPLLFSREVSRAWLDTLRMPDSRTCAASDSERSRCLMYVRKSDRHAASRSSPEGASS